MEQLKKPSLILKKNYSAPVVEIIKQTVENGFADSDTGGGGNIPPVDDGGDL